MRFLQTRTFVNLGALAALIASLLLIEMPAKARAEPSLLFYVPHAFLTGLTWLVLSVVRFLSLQRSDSL